MSPCAKTKQKKNQERLRAAQAQQGADNMHVLLRRAARISRSVQPLRTRHKRVVPPLGGTRLKVSVLAQQEYAACTQSHKIHTSTRRLRSDKASSPSATPESSLSLRMKESMYSGIVTFLGFGALSCVNYMHPADYTLLLGSFGATAALVFGEPQAPFSQPRNVIGGHVMAAGIGATASMLLAPHLAAPVAVASSVAAMQATRTMHPPAGGTTLIAVIGSEKVKALGLSLVVPAGVGACLLTAAAVALAPLIQRTYPVKWF